MIILYIVAPASLKYTIYSVRLSVAPVLTGVSPVSTLLILSILLELVRCLYVFKFSRKWQFKKRAPGHGPYGPSWLPSRQAAPYRYGSLSLTYATWKKIENLTGHMPEAVKRGSVIGWMNAGNTSDALACKSEAHCQLGRDLFPLFFCLELTIAVMNYRANDCSHVFKHTPKRNRERAFHPLPPFHIPRLKNALRTRIIPNANKTGPAKFTHQSPLLVSQNELGRVLCFTSPRIVSLNC